MKAWYLSQRRFEKRILKHWQKSGLKYNSGNVNILKYAFRTVIVYANLDNKKVSKVNEIEKTLKLF